MRAATNALPNLADRDRARGEVAASAGNHGRALSAVARAMGSQATICMSHLVSENKVSEIRCLGGDVPDHWSIS